MKRVVSDGVNMIKNTLTSNKTNMWKFTSHREFEILITLWRSKLSQMDGMQRVSLQRAIQNWVTGMIRRRNTVRKQVSQLCN